MPNSTASPSPPVPGSFTGLRVGIAAARGIALAAAKPSVGLSTLAAYAAPLIAKDDSIPVLAVIDARHDQVYLQVFGVGGRTLVSPRIGPIQEAVRVSRGPARADRRLGRPCGCRGLAGGLSGAVAGGDASCPGN